MNYEVKSQNYTQSIRGTVFDKFSKQPLSDANIIVNFAGQVFGTSSDAKGEFVVRNVAAGRCDIRVSTLGFTPYISNSVLVYSGKETIHEIVMEENIETIDEVVVTPKIEKELPLNKQATGSHVDTAQCGGGGICLD
jgi:hypothetical protein